MSLRVLVCDDEPIAISRLTAMLERIGGVDVVGTALDGASAVRVADAERPDLVLLDIEMPGPDGFETARSIERLAAAAGRRPPLVTFVTAYRRLAPDAFDSGAIDFLSKPVRRERVEQCLDRARGHASARASEDRVAHLEERLAALQSEGGREEPHVWVQRRGETVRVDLRDVERVDADGPYVHLRSAAGTFLHREAISVLAERLCAIAHLRVHRSHIVRIDQVSRIRRTGHGGAELIMRNGQAAPVGRSYAKDVRRRLLHLEEPS